MIRLGWNNGREVEGIVVPWWMGLADIDYATRRYLFLPVPYNVVYRWGVRVWIWIKFARGRSDPMPKHDCYSKGWRDAWTEKERQDKEFFDRINERLGIRK